MSTAKTGAPTPSFGWLLSSSLWMLLTLIPGPFFLWAGFAYIGFRARKKSWKIAAGIYAALTVIATVYSLFVGATTHTEPTTQALSVLFPIAIQLAGILHAALANPTWLRIMWQKREGTVHVSAGARTFDAPTVPKEAAPLLNAPGIRSEDFFDGDSTTSENPSEPVDVNTATAKELAALPGVSRKAAATAVKARTARNGFASVDDFSEAAGLQPHQFLAVRAAASCSRRATVRHGFGRRVDL